MAIKRYFADADNTITNAFRPSLTTRGTNANMGASDVLEVFSIYGQASSGSTELERVLIKFPISEITGDRSTGDLPIPGGVSFYLKMSNARHSQTVPRQFTMNISAVSRSWEEGFGLDMDGYSDIVYPNNEGSTWMSASQTEAWTRMGGDYHDSPVYTDYFDTGIEDLEVDVTPLIEEWIAGTKENYGFGVHLTASQEGYYAIYDERESVNYDTAAYLSASIGTMTETEPFTFGVWVYPTDSIATRYIGFWTAPSLTSGVRYLYRNSAGTLFFTSKYAGADLNAYTSVGALPQDVWTHVALSHNPSDLAALPTVYINGISASITMASFPPTGTPDAAVGFSVGGWGEDVTNWSGSIDDVAYYNSVLSSAEVLEIYNNGCPVDLKSLDSVSSLKSWWINGDDPNDDIRLGNPPTQPSIYDQIGSQDLYATGSGGMKITTGACAEQAPGGNKTTGELINYAGSQYSFYTKKFFGRNSEFYYKRPYIEARWDSALKDDRGSFYASSSLLSAEDNLHTIYLYNIFGGKLKNIPGVGTGEIYVKTFDSSSGGTDLTPTAVTGGFVSTGVYSASFALETTLTTVYDRWYNSGLTTCYHTGTIGVKSHAASAYNPNPKYVINITNLKPSYTKDEQVRFRLYSRQKDWSPTIYTVANSNIETLTIESASYQIHRIVDDLLIVPYGTSSDNYTQMSYDVSGNYFDFDMSVLQTGYSYGIKVAFYDENSYVEQPYLWKFRVESLNEY